MTSNSSLSAAKTSATLLLVAVDFLLFYQTAIGGSFAKFISQMLLLILPFLADFRMVIPFLLFGLFSAFMALVYVAARDSRVSVFSLISFLLFLPAAISTPSVNWLGNTDLAHVQPFLFTVIGGFTILSCLIILSNATRLSKTGKELLKRGANISEIQSVTKASLSFAAKAVAGSIALSATAVVLYVLGQPLGSQIASSSVTYLPFIVGIAAVVTASVLIYYFLIRRDTSFA